MSKRDASLVSEEDFDKAFPQIAKLDMAIIMVMAGQNGFAEFKIGGSNYREYITCSNLCCPNGIFQLALAIGPMISKRQIHAADSKLCSGYEGSPKGRKRYRSCLTEFSYAIDIEYKVERVAR
jgi:hypothetical protein